MDFEKKLNDSNFSLKKNLRQTGSALKSENRLAEKKAKY